MRPQLAVSVAARDFHLLNLRVDFIQRIAHRGDKVRDRASVKPTPGIAKRLVGFACGQREGVAELAVGEHLVALGDDRGAVELAAGDRHFERLREGRPESIETSSLHLDILCDLKRIHSHICSVAYPVLEAAGEIPALGTTRSDAAADSLTYQPKLP